MTIAPATVRRIEFILEQSGLAERLATALRKDNRGRKQNSTTIELLLLGLFLAVHQNRSATISDIHSTLFALSLEDRLRLKISVPDPTSPDGTKANVTINQLYYVSKTIAQRLSYGDSADEKLSEDERHRRHHLVQAMCQSVMDVFDLGWNPTHVALDATGIWSWARGKRSVEEDPIDNESTVGAVTASFDRDAHWGIKTSKNGDTERFFGYHEHTLVQIPGPRETVDDIPPLIRAFEITPSNRDVVDVSLRIIDAVQGTIANLVVDSHSSYKAAERWRAPLYDRGIRQHLDLRATDHGFTESNRLRWAAGRAHCPATPDPLGTIKPPALTGPNRHKNQAVFQQQIDLREHYALRLVTTPDRAGTQRVECPAEAGKLGCPLRSGTTQIAIAHGLPVVENPPDLNSAEGLPKCCTQRTVKVTPPPAHVKLIQPNYWGSAEWHRVYGARTYVEGSYGNRKNPSTEDLRRGHFRVVGLHWVHLVMAAVNASYNLRTLRNWHERTGSGPVGHPLLTRDPAYTNVIFLTDEQTRGLAQRSCVA